MWYLRCAVAVFALIAAAVTAPAASAGGTLLPLAAQFPARYEQPAGPAFAGGAIAWATPHPGGGFDVTVDRGGEFTTHAIGGPPDLADAVLAASADDVAIAVNAQSCAGYEACKYGDYTLDESEVFAGALGQQLAFQDCGSELVDSETADGFDSIDLSGSVLAYLDGCAGGVVVRDLAAPRGTPWQVFPGHDVVRVAGPYLAIDSFKPGDLADEQPPPRITVYDRRSGQTVFGVDGTPPFDIRDDGTLVYRTAGADPQLAWASPGDPAPHPLGHGDAHAVRIGGGSVAARTPDRLVVFDLAGRDITAIAASEEAGSFDYDGTRLVYATQPCEVIGVVTWDLGGAAPAFGPGDCPPAIASRVVADLRHRVMKVRVRCPATPPLGCSGDWYAIVRDPTFDATPGQLGALGPGQAATLRLPLSRRQACAYAYGRVRRTNIELGASGRRPAIRQRRTRFRVHTVGRPRRCS